MEWYLIKVFVKLTIYVPLLNYVFGFIGGILNKDV